MSQNDHIPLKMILLNIRSYQIVIFFLIMSHRQANINPTGNHEIQLPIVHAHHDELVCSELLRRVGADGPYQDRVYYVLFMMTLIGSSCFLVAPYLFMIDPYQCEGLTSTQCNQMVCALPQEQRSKYLGKQTMKNLANQFGDMHCQREYEVTIMMSALLLGTSIGVAISIIFTEVIGRKAIFMVALAIGAIGPALVLADLGMEVRCIGLFIWGSGAEIVCTLIFNFAIEVANQSRRMRGNVYILIFFSLGTLANSPVFYLFKDWKDVLGFYYLLFNSLGLLLLGYFIQDTPIELVTRHSPEHSYAALLHMAEVNGVKDHGFTLEEVVEIQQDYAKIRQMMKHEQQFSIIDVFRFPSIRGPFLNVALFFILMMFNLYGPALLLDQFAIDIYLDGFLNGLSQLINIPLLLVYTDTFPRRQGQMICMFASGVFGLISYFLLPQNCVDCDHSTIVLVQIVFFGFRFFVHLSASFFFATTINEIFPAQIRAVAVSCVIGSGRFGTLILPFLSKISQQTHVSLMMMVTVGCFLCTLSAYLMPQTVGLPLPEIIQELKKELDHEREIEHNKEHEH